jgi:hypothetical protein
MRRINPMVLPMGGNPIRAVCPATAPMGYARPAISGGLVGRWICGVENGNDYSGNRNHGTLLNNPTFGTFKYGPCLILNGVNQTLQIPNSATLDFPGDMTVCVWTKALGAVTANGFFCKRNASGGQFQMWLSDPVGDHLVLWNGATTIPSPTAIHTGITPADFNHICVTRSGTTVTGYANGIEYWALPHALPPSGTQDIFVGGNAQSTFANSAMYDARLYRVALSAAQIRAIINGQG